MPSALLQKKKKKKPNWVRQPQLGWIPMITDLLQNIVASLLVGYMTALFNHWLNKYKQLLLVISCSEIAQ